MRYVIGDTLRQARKNAGYSVEEVLHLLEEKGVHSSIKSIYGWENEFCYPPLEKFLVLCEIYEIQDILGTFRNNDNA